LRECEHPFGEREIADGVSDVDKLQAAAGRDQRFEREGEIEGGVPGGNAARQDAAHGKRRVKPVGVTLDEACGDDAAKGMAPGDGVRGRTNQLLENIEHGNLVMESFV